VTSQLHNFILYHWLISYTHMLLHSTRRTK